MEHIPGQFLFEADCSCGAAEMCKWSAKVKYPSSQRFFCAQQHLLEFLRSVGGADVVWCGDMDGAYLMLILIFMTYNIWWDEMKFKKEKKMLVRAGD